MFTLVLGKWDEVKAEKGKGLTPVQAVWVHETISQLIEELPTLAAEYLSPNGVGWLSQQLSTLSENDTPVGMYAEGCNVWLIRGSLAEFVKALEDDRKAGEVTFFDNRFPYLVNYRL
jgi:hypothetical protein